MSGKAFIPICTVISNKKNKQNKKMNSLQNRLQTKLLESGLFVQQQLYNILRPHQIEGVNFMYECISGSKSDLISGCILADFMGLGKTLQALTLIYSLLRKKQIKKSVVVCPLTLVSVWKKQCEKWLKQKLIPLECLGDGQQVLKTVKNFSGGDYRMLIISYQSFSRTIDLMNGKCDLIIFDEGHRLKNQKTKFFKKIKNFSCKKRLLLTGTPLQNNLEQLYACISLVNPLMFDNDTKFKNVFQKPILAGMAQSATNQEKVLAQSRTQQLAARIKEFSLRRKAQTLEKYLPEKFQHLIFFKMTSLQKLWYDRAVLKKQKQDNNEVMSLLSKLRKLFTHPSIFSTSCIDHGEWSEYSEDISNQISPKIQFSLSIIEKCLQNNEKIIIVSYFTETLDYFENIFKGKSYRYSKLDGRTTGKERNRIIEIYKKEKDILLLSGKAGGTGLTLTQATRMIIVEPDWNPSNDNQVMGRIWRQGQQKIVQIYRLFMASTFQQKILQRQQFKQTLSQKLIDQKLRNKQTFDFLNLKKLFIENLSECLTFKQDSSTVQKFLQKESLTLQSIIHIEIRKSHQTEYKIKNEFEEINFMEEIQETENEVNTDSQQQSIEKQEKCIKLTEKEKQKIQKGKELMMEKQKKEEKNMQKSVKNEKQIENTDIDNQQVTTIQQEHLNGKRQIKLPKALLKIKQIKKETK